MSNKNNDLPERLLECEKELENLRKKVEELAQGMHGFGKLIEWTNARYMRFFDRVIAIIEQMNSLFEQLPESIAKVAVEQLKKELIEAAKLLEEARKKSYVV